MSRGGKTIRALGLLAVALLAAVGLALLLAGSEEPRSAPPPPRPSGGAGATAPLPDRTGAEDELPAVEPLPAPRADSGSSDAPLAVSADAEHGADDEAQGRPGRVAGRVETRDGRGVADATVTLRRLRMGGQGGDRAEVSLTTDALGEFHAELAPGMYLVAAAPPERLAHLAQASQPLRLRPGADELLDPLVLEPALTLAGAVRDEAGRPISGATVSARMERGWSSWEATSDGAGAYRLEGLREGLVRVTADAPGHVEATRDDVPVTARAAPLDLVLQTAGTIEGTIRGVTGQPEPRAWVFAYRGAERLDQARTDGQGRFRLTVAPGAVQLFVRSDDRAGIARAAAEVAAGALAVADVVLEPSLRIAGTLRDEAGEPLARWRVLARSLGGDVTRQARTDEAGAFTLTGLYPGTYRLLAQRGGGRGRGGGAPRELGQVEVSRGELAVDLVAPTGASVAGRVVTRAGAPAAGVAVFAVVGEDYRAQGQTDEEGRFRLEGIRLALDEALALFVRHFPRGGEELVARLPLTLTPEGALEGLLVTVAPPAQLTGRVLHAGQPLPEITIEVQGVGVPVRRRARSDGEGRFTIGPLYDGEYELQLDPGALKLAAARLAPDLVLAATPVRFTIEGGRSLTRDVLVRVAP